MLPLSTDLIGDLGRADVRAGFHDFGDGALAAVRLGVMDHMAIDVQLIRAIVHLPERFDDPAVHCHCDGERLESRAELIDAERRAVEPRLGRSLARGIGIELRKRRHRKHLAGADIHHDARRANRGEMGHSAQQLGLERLLNPAVDRQSERLTAGRGIRQIFVERALHPSDSVAVDIGVADDVRRKAGLRVKPIGFTLDGEARLSERVHRFDQFGRSPAPEIKERLSRPQHCEILFRRMLGHQLGEMVLRA